LLTERLARTALAGPALEMSLHCDALVQAPAPNAELFPTRSAETEGLTRLIERLQARLGPEGVLRLELAADHRPERAAAWTPAQSAAVRSASAPSRAPDGAPVRPLWLLPEPLPLPEHASRPWLDGTPLQLLAGPERIESGWWDGDLAARDYFIARAHDGALVWVYRARLPLSSTPGRSQIDEPPSGLSPDGNGPVDRSRLARGWPLAANAPCKGGGRKRPPGGTHSADGAGWFLQGRFA
jgi:protein ImuB